MNPKPEKKARRIPAADRSGHAHIRLTSGVWTGYVNGKRITDFYWVGLRSQEQAAREWLKEASKLA